MGLGGLENENALAVEITTMARESAIVIGLELGNGGLEAGHVGASLLVAYSAESFFGGVFIWVVGGGS